MIKINIVIERTFFIPEKANPYQDNSIDCYMTGNWQLCYPSKCENCIYDYFYKEIGRYE